MVTSDVGIGMATQLGLNSIYAFYLISVVEKFYILYVQEVVAHFM